MLARRSLLFCYHRSNFQMKSWWTLRVSCNKAIVCLIFVWDWFVWNSNLSIRLLCGGRSCDWGQYQGEWAPCHQADRQSGQPRGTDPRYSVCPTVCILVCLPFRLSVSVCVQSGQLRGISLKPLATAGCRCCWFCCCVQCCMLLSFKRCCHQAQ